MYLGGWAGKAVYRFYITLPTHSDMWVYYWEAILTNLPQLD